MTKPSPAPMSTSAKGVKQLKVTQHRSVIGRPESQRRVLRGLGLRGMHQSVLVANTPDFRGMIKKVLHMVSVEEIAGLGSSVSDGSVSDGRGA